MQSWLAKSVPTFLFSYPLSYRGKTVAVKYLQDHYDVKFIRKPVPRRGMLQLAPGQGADGYGSKISTDFIAIIGGIQHRVYYCCFSNAGSHYVLVKGETFYLRELENWPEA